MKLISRYKNLSILLFGWVAISLSACEKYNQVDNSSTVKTPYTLFIGGYDGTVQKTNDALSYNSLFSTDNSITRQIIVADSNIIYLKDYIYCSNNDGKTFPRSAPFTPVLHIDKFKKYYLPNTGLYEPNTKIVYMCGNTNDSVKGGQPINMLKSTDFGKTFQADNNFIDPIMYPTSITQLKNGLAYIMQDSSRIYKRIRKDTVGWVKVSQNATNPLGSNTAKWYISHKGDSLFAIDYFGKKGIYYSTDASNWFKCTGIPTSKKILFANQAFGNNEFYVGLDSGGLYRLNGTNFVPTGPGIPWYAKIGFVEGKTVTYRTDAKRTYLFAATDVGLYISETNGFDWRLIRNGTYATLQ
jgi:hypothetical protein